MATSTIVLLVIGVLILVVLVLGFTKGWESLKVWMPSDNVDNIDKSCAVSCTTNDAYCSKTKNVNDGNNPKFDATCDELSTEPAYASYGIDPCPGLC